MKQYIINILIAYTFAIIVFFYNEYRMGKLGQKLQPFETKNPIIEKLDPLNVIPEETKDLGVDETSLKNVMPYSDVNLKYAKVNGKVLIYFTSGRCIRCKEFIDSLDKGELPNDIIILIAQFESPLASKYKIQTEDTIIQLDENEKELSKWRYPDQNNILQNIR